MDEYLEYFRTTPKEEWEREALHAEFPNAPLSAFWVTLEEIEASKHLDFDSSAALHAGNLLNTEAYTTYFNHHPFERWSYTHFNANTNRSYEVWMWALFQRSSQQNPPLSHDETDQLLFLRNQKQRVLEPSSTSKPKSINTNPPSSSIQPSDTDIDANTPIDSTDTESGAAKGLKRGVTSKPQWFQGKRKKSANSSHNEDHLRKFLSEQPLDPALEWFLTTGKSVNQIVRNDKIDALAEISILDLSPGSSTFERQKWSDVEWKEMTTFADIGIPEINLPDIPELSSDARELGAGLIMKGEYPDAFPELGAVLVELVRRYESNTMSTPHNERGVDCWWDYILTGAFDRTDMFISRGETCSLSIKDFLNWRRQSLDIPVVMGPKFDGIILSRETDRGLKRIEYGYIEVAKSAKKPYEAKFINDHVKILRAMIASLLPETKGLRVSVMCLGLQLVVSYMVRHKSGLFILYCRPAVNLPLCFSGESIGLVLKEVAVLRYILGLAKEWGGNVRDQGDE